MTVAAGVAGVVGAASRGGGSSWEGIVSCQGVPAGMSVVADAVGHPEEEDVPVRA